MCNHLPQLGKRNLTEPQRIEFVLVLEPMIADQAKKNQSLGGELYGKGVQKPAQPIETQGTQSKRNPTTREQVAQIAGVSHDKITKYKQIKEQAPPELG